MNIVELKIDEYTRKELFQMFVEINTDPKLLKKFNEIRRRNYLSVKKAKGLLKAGLKKLFYKKERKKKVKWEEKIVKELESQTQEIEKSAVRFVREENRRKKIEKIKLQCQKEEEERREILQVHKDNIKVMKVFHKRDASCHIAIEEFNTHSFERNQAKKTIMRSKSFEVPYEVEHVEDEDDEYWREATEGTVISATSVCSLTLSDEGEDDFVSPNSSPNKFGEFEGVEYEEFDDENSDMESVSSGEACQTPKKNASPKHYGNSLTPQTPESISSMVSQLSQPMEDMQTHKKKKSIGQEFETGVEEIAELKRDNSFNHSPKRNSNYRTPVKKIKMNYANKGEYINSPVQRILQNAVVRRRASSLKFTKRPILHVKQTSLTPTKFSDKAFINGGLIAVNSSPICSACSGRSEEGKSAIFSTIERVVLFKSPNYRKSHFIQGE